MAVGVLQLFDGSWLSALVLAFFGGLLAVVGWRRGRIVLESPESASLIAKERPRQSVGARAETEPWTVNG
jgi:membrane protein implicated in regulation of membrane protease activity